MIPAAYGDLVSEIEREFGTEFEQISHYLFEHPELGLQEHKSAAHLVAYIKEKGFRVETPFCGFDTAFRAQWGEKGPAIVFPAEYDALPGYGEDKHNGHACGHNWIAATTAGAAVVLAEICRRKKLEARVILMGTPAEETYCTKVKMVEDGAFSDVDCAIQAHLAAGTCVCPKALAMTALKILYRGKAAHSAGAPWDGINALDAVQLFYAGLNALRQHVKPDVRLHGIVTEGGQAANIVPDKASCLFYVRSAHRNYLNTVLDKVGNVAKGAALMTGASLEIEYPELPMDDLIDLPTLEKMADGYLRAQGVVPTVTAEDAALLAGSTDIGNVSHACPTCYFEVGLDSPVSFEPHQESALTLTDSPYAYKRLHQTVNTMASMGLELILDPELLRHVKQDFADTAK
jgi:amidohydrolase